LKSTISGPFFIIPTSSSRLVIFGRSDSAVRTPEQTDIAYFWQAVNVHQGLVDVAIERGLDIRQTARFFAVVYTASTDANIAGYEAKYFYRLWGPRTAIPRVPKPTVTLIPTPIRPGLR
jgi:hypothetical protein